MYDPLIVSVMDGIAREKPDLEIYLGDSVTGRRLGQSSELERLAEPQVLTVLAQAEPGPGRWDW